MDIRLHNTLSQEKDVFKPILPGKVGMYHCGPTVYDTPHIGNYRTFILNDIIRRVFEYDDYKVTQVMNITDIDDKTIRRSQEEGVDLKVITQRYEGLFLEGLRAMNILMPHHLLRATEHIAEMKTLIGELVEKGIAYQAADGVYLNISKVKNYGKLARLKLSKENDHKERITNDEYDKENPHDFALWKNKDDEKYVSGNLTLNGRPGWHIECSAMAMKILGPTIDIHTGGQDLIFPHHTNEIAQSESATGKTFVHFWLHGAFVNVSEEKMAKSKGNFIKLENLQSESISPLAYRYWLLTAHYRSPVNFTYEAVRAAQNALIRLIAAVGAYPDGGEVSLPYQERFTAFINDDLDMPKAVALAWELVKDASVSDADKRTTLIDFDQVFGLKLADAPRPAVEAIPPEIQALADAREEARKAKDWAKADALRAEIEARGYDLNDTVIGASIQRK